MAEKLISTAEAATALANRRQRDRADAQGVYARLMIKSQLAPQEAESLAAAVELLNIPSETIAADSRAADRARHLHEIKRVAYSPETEKAREDASFAVQQYILETDRIMEERMKVLSQLREEQHRADGVYLAYHKADAELAALERQHPFLTGLRLLS